jgi:predicted negative regulator of RcsB-dependent stress response
MTPITVLALGVALAFAAFCGYLLWRLDAQTQRTKAIAAQNKRLKQVARNKEAECVRLAGIVRKSEAAYAELQESFNASGWVRVLTDEELHEGVWP